MIYIYTDGASRNNPGKSASGYLILDEKGKVVWKDSFYNGIKTNNQAEYIAVIAALEKALGLSEREAKLFSDSELIINQLKGRYRVKEAGLKGLHGKAKGLAARFDKLAVESVPRENRYISMVDKELNMLLDGLGC